ncbi:hypothetical protein [Roseinatronobacter sp. NSM]|uniref:hypothetical protein n=1 Tax=Roseinatronobacter sp. NSM TaxID=3457785 RepID=UPI0040353013
MAFAGAFLKGMAGGVTARNDYDLRQREISAIEALGQKRSESRQGMSLSPDSMQPANQNSALRGQSRPRAGMGSQEVRFNNWMSNPDLARGIMETADDLGMDPLDLATIISYETAGTFDPTKRGPTTQWGQHRGLIQFGEPQARQHGVNWDDPIRSQLGRDGAIARYYRSSGWKPGMGLMDAYSIVNAGGPGLHHRSDANNGGAPGTVADKVNSQMAGHRQKAEAMLTRFQSSSPEPEQDNEPSTWGWAREYQRGNAR